MNRNVIIGIALCSVLVACDDGSKQRAESERLAHEAQDLAAKHLEQANQLVGSSVELANQQIKNAQAGLTANQLPADIAAQVADARKQVEAASAATDAAMLEAQKQIQAAHQQALQEAERLKKLAEAEH